MHLAVTNIDTQLRRDFFGNNFNIKGGCGGGVKVQIDFWEAFASTTLSSRWMMPSRRSPSFSSINAVTSRLTATVIALVDHKIVSEFMVEFAPGQTQLFHGRQRGHRGGIRQQRYQMHIGKRSERL